MSKHGDNLLQAMMTDESSITHIFCGYDGVVSLSGCGTMPWPGVPYEESQVQQIPRWARKIAGDRNLFRRWAHGLFKRLHKTKRV